MDLKVFVEVDILTKTSTDFMASLEVSVISKKSRVRKIFYKCDYIKNGVEWEEACDQFCKYLLEEYFYLVKKDPNKLIMYNIKCNRLVGMMINNSLYIDQLRAHLGNYPAGVFVMLKGEKK